MDRHIDKITMGLQFDVLKPEKKEKKMVSVFKDLNVFMPPHSCISQKLHKPKYASKIVY